MMGRRVQPAWTCTISALRAAGAYDVATLTTPAAAHPGWAAARPGQFVVLPQDPATGAVLPEVHWIAGTATDPLHGTSFELVLPVGRELSIGHRMDVLGPLGRGFALPAHPVTALVVGHGSGSNAVGWLSRALRERGCRVLAVLAVPDADHVVDLHLWRRSAETVQLCTSENLPSVAQELIDAEDLADGATGVDVIYGVLPRDLGTRLAEVAQGMGRPARIAPLDLDEPIRCGTGLCGGCEITVGPPGGSPRATAGPRTARLRPCLDGPVLPGEMLLTTGPSAASGPDRGMPGGVRGAGP